MKSDEWLTKTETTRESYFIEDLFVKKVRRFYLVDTETNKRRITVKCVYNHKVGGNYKSELWRVFIVTEYITVPVGMIDLHEHRGDDLKEEVIKLIEKDIEMIIERMRGWINYSKKDLKDIKNIFSEKLGINQVSLLEIDNVD